MAQLSKNLIHQVKRGLPLFMDDEANRLLKVNVLKDFQKGDVIYALNNGTGLIQPIVFMHYTHTCVCFKHDIKDKDRAKYFAYKQYRFFPTLEKAKVGRIFWLNQEKLRLVTKLNLINTELASLMGELNGTPD
jgi:hypothetical protein